MLPAKITHLVLPSYVFKQMGVFFAKQIVDQKFVAIS
jgi:hypothetical protein